MEIARRQGKLLLIVDVGAQLMELILISLLIVCGNLVASRLRYV